MIMIKGKYCVQQAYLMKIHARDRSEIFKKSHLEIIAYDQIQCDNLNKTIEDNARNYVMSSILVDQVFLRDETK